MSESSPPPRRSALPWRRVDDAFRWVIEHPGTIDAIVFGTAAALFALVGLATAPTVGAWWALYSVPMIAVGAIGRTRPAWCMTVVAVLAVLHMAVLMPVVVGDVMTFYAFYCAVAYGTARTHAIGVALGMLGVLMQSLFWAGAALTDAGGDPVVGAGVFIVLLISGSVTILAIWALARLQHARVRQLALSRERAEQAVREREQRTALAVADERARIAREMHDVVAHSLSVMIAQADGGRYLAQKNPDAAADVLGTIAGTGRAALADMRSLLGVLRAEEETTFGPQPGLDQIGDLAERVRAAGLSVDLQMSEGIDHLPQALGMSVFRLVQEALTNVMKHAGPEAAARVSLRLHGPVLEVQVLDDGRGHDPDSDGLGHGLTGMRERVSAFGGDLQVGPLPGRGYRVLARFPVPTDGVAPATAERMITR